MKVKLLSYTDLSICDIAISKCYGKEPYEEIEKQQARINRVANVSKHSSVVEHLRVTFIIDNKDIADIFKKNSFSYVTEVDKNYIITTNVRALQEIKLDDEIKKTLIPNEYVFLFLVNINV